MRTTGIVKWFDRSTGIGVVALADGGGDCVVRLATAEVAHGTGEGRGPACRGAAGAGVPRRGTWRDYVPTLADAERAGTWGDGGRDY